MVEGVAAALWVADNGLVPPLGKPRGASPYKLVQSRRIAAQHGYIPPPASLTHPAIPLGDRRGALAGTWPQASTCHAAGGGVGGTGRKMGKANKQPHHHPLISELTQNNASAIA